jgi:RNA polymerase sigma-70 factor (ECF subfamily)
MDERRLILDAQRGRPDAFAELVRLHQGRLRAFAARYVANPDDVFELVQDAFLDAFRSLARVDAERPFGPWVRALVLNRVRNFFRSRRARPGLLAVDAAIEERIRAEVDPGDLDERRIEAMRACVAELGEGARGLVDLRYHAGLPVKEIASRLECSPASVSVRLGRIRAALLDCVTRRLATVPE